MGHDALNPILLTVITNRLESIAREMGAGMLRSSRSPIFAETRDFVTAIFEPQLRLVGQTAYIPVLMGGSAIAVRSISEHFAGDVHEGDVMVLNDPYRGNSHLPDLTVVKPVFLEGRLWFWVLARGHHADIGGGGAAGYNPNARTIWEEGLRIPPCKLYQQGVYHQDIWNLILLNVRLPLLVEGDLQCQVGACQVGERELLQLLQQYGRQDVQTAIEEMLRFESPVQSLARRTTRAVSIHGVEIPEGSEVRLMWGAANLDDREFERRAVAGRTEEFDQRAYRAPEAPDEVLVWARLDPVLAL